MSTATVRSLLWEASARPVSLWRTPRVRSLLLLAVLGSAAGALVLAAQIYTSLLWFDEVGQSQVFWTTLKWRVVAEGFFPLATTSFLLLNFAIVERNLAARSGGLAVWRPVATVWPFRTLVYPVVALGAGFAVSQLRPVVGWQQLLLWSHRGDFGQTDPLFHRDVGYYVFSLPLYEHVARWLIETLVLAGAMSLAIYAAAGAVQLVRPRGALRAARRHVLILVALILVAMAWRMHLDQFQLALPHTGSAVPGASYTDVHVRLPALRVLMWLALAGAVLAVCAAVRKVPSTALVAVGVLATLLVLVMGSLPRLIERYEVAPQQLSRERPYVEYGIAGTRRAFELDGIREVPVPGNAKLTEKSIADNKRTLDNVQLWDPSVLRAAMNEVESIGRYYHFSSTTVDRYKINGAEQLITVAARGLDLGRLEQNTRGWATQRFAYTHGYGVVGARAGQTDAQRYPRFAEHDFDAGTNPLKVLQPRTYFGEQRRGGAPPYLVVNSSRAEIEQPAPGSRAPAYHYDGSAGIPISSMLRRVAFAARFRDIKLLLTETVGKESRMVLHADARDRLTAIAPFLRWDARPETAVVDGRIQFLFHGYTETNHHPYSEPVHFGGGDANYVRAGVIATVDGFSGRVSVYAADEDDPILRAWRSAYPSLFLPAARMPSGLRDHLRYPKALLKAQSEAYENYHATDGTAFWNGADAWQRPLRVAGPVDRAGEIRFPAPVEHVDPDERRAKSATPAAWQMQPDYMLARLPGDKRERFMLVMPFTPRGRNNLVGYLSGSVDRLGRPNLTLLSLPRDRLTIGPAQATRRILGSPGVNRRVELLNRESRDLGKAAINRTVLGSPHLVPVGDALVYVQPIYVTAGGSSVPRLQLVTVHANGRVGYGRELKPALKRVAPGP